MTNRATGTFDVNLTSQPLADEAASPLLSRLSIGKTFSGDLTGASRGEMLSAGTGTKGSAGYVALERVTGTLARTARDVRAAALGDDEPG